MLILCLNLYYTNCNYSVVFSIGYILLYIFSIGYILIYIQPGLVSSVRRALASKLRGLGFKSRPGTVGGPVTIIMWGAWPGWKLALS